MDKKFRGVFLLATLFWGQIATAQDIAQVCSTCNGKGTHECSLCEGKGKWKAEIDGKKKKIECPHCKGSELQHCWLCGGTGKDVIVVTPNTSATHPDGYSWLWCSSCEYQGVVRCTRCRGRGKLYARNGEVFVCGLCDGKRYVLCTNCQGSCGWYVMRLKCELCEGNGSITCSHCNGQGWLPPENVDKAYAEVCKLCKGHRVIPHKECEGKGCKYCKNGKVKCEQCNGHGAVIITPEPKYKDCRRCNHKGVQNCSACKGRGYRIITEAGVVK